MSTSLDSIRRAIGALLASLVYGGCTTLGPQALDQTRLQYNEVVKRTTEEQLLLNIVRLRYNESTLFFTVGGAKVEQEVAVEPRSASKPIERHRNPQRAN